MILLIFLGQAAAVCGQTRPESFFVKYITLETETNSRFVWRLANMIISSDKESNINETACLKEELLKTGLFSKVEWRLHELKEPNNYELVLTVKFNSPDIVYKISKISLSGFKEVDESKFKDLLGSEGLIGKSVSLKTGYSDFEKNIIELVEKSMRDQTTQEEYDLPWFEFRLDENKELEITLMPQFRGCPKAPQ